MDARRPVKDDGAPLVEAVSDDGLRGVHHEPLKSDPDREARWTAWRVENAEAIAASNAWYEENGHPLAAYMLEPGDPLPR